MRRRQNNVGLVAGGYRNDGRLRDEVRDSQFIIGKLSSRCDGSAEVRHGCTRVVAYASGPLELAGASPNGLIVKCSFTVAPFSRPFRSVQRMGNKRCSARAGTLESLLSAVIRGDSYRKSTIVISIVVLQDDGGVLAAAINAAMLSLIDAGVLLNDVVAACTVTLADSDAPLVDPTDEETRISGAELTLATYRSTGEYACMECWARVSTEDFNRMLIAAENACQRTADALIDAVLDFFDSHNAIRQEDTELKA